ncbi:hypothetical protein BDN72DRAFT_826641 [Pluteus cervinus]|uniref:Uncharacterized protein n=1 Tax=Pluteus cervinus TaxID=181527 RepID=A0ACD3ACP6_9AGAR|nr:hypothetical protein BDN72DRAFT_826641 [Pluteus cervinus]
MLSLPTSSGSRSGPIDGLPTIQTPRYEHGQEPTTLSTTDTLNGPTNSPFLGSSTTSLTSSSPTPTSEVPKPKTDPVPTIKPYQPSDYIPPNPNGRTLILCFDGTGDQFDIENSNVVQLLSLLKKDDKKKQRVYYQSGIGTYDPPPGGNPITRKISKVLDIMIAWDLDRHVMDGYQFLMQNYTQGDKICIFGFSRGAYTARSLAGMLHKVGLLPAGNVQQVALAYKLYKREDEFGWMQSNEFKRACSIDVSIEFVGVWDTVASVGITGKRLPFTTSNTIIKTFRHAVSLDERRVNFEANLWHKSTQQQKELGCPSPGIPRRDCSDTSSTTNTELSVLKQVAAELQPAETDVEEVWFAGCHCDIGGGSVTNDVRYSLSRISLRWMVRECFKAKTGIMFNVEGLRRLGMDPNRLYPEVKPRPKPLHPTLHKPCEPKEVTPKPIHKRISGFVTEWLGPRRSKEKKVTNSAGKTIGSLADEWLQKLDGDMEGTNDEWLKTEGRGELEKLTADRRAIIDVGTEEEEELYDALSRIYDQLKAAKGWWILEYLPLTSRYQDPKSKVWVTKTKINRARPRKIPGRGLVNKKTKRPYRQIPKAKVEFSSSQVLTDEEPQDRTPSPTSTSTDERPGSQSATAPESKAINHTIKVHRSVAIRAEATHLPDPSRPKRYEPRAWFSPEVTIEYVD